MEPQDARGRHEKVGKKGPRWDKPARAALESAARFFSRAADPATTEEDFYPLVKQALDAGCDDPLILYLYARALVVPNYPGLEEYTRRMTTAALALERSRYPALRKAVALQKAGQLKLGKDATSEQRREAARLLDAALALVPQAGSKDERGVDADTEWYYGVLSPLLERYRQLGGDYQAAFNKVDAVLARVPALNVVRLQLRGDFFTRYAQEARGAGLASTVSEENQKLFQARLAEADKALKQAWTLQPSNVRTPTLMLGVVKGLGAKRAEMETWFKRALEADGNNYLACEMKMDWLEPKWYGSRDDLLAFGRACRATKNWRGAHAALAPVPPPGRPPPRPPGAGQVLRVAAGVGRRPLGVRGVPDALPEELPGAQPLRGALLPVREVQRGGRAIRASRRPPERQRVHPPRHDEAVAGIRRGKGGMTTRAAGIMIRGTRPASSPILSVGEHARRPLFDITNDDEGTQSRRSGRARRESNPIRDPVPNEPNSMMRVEGKNQVAGSLPELCRTNPTRAPAPNEATR